MFKKLVFTAAVLMLIASKSFAAGMKIAVFDERLVLTKVPQFELIEAKIQKKFADRITEIKKLKEKGVAMQEKGKRDSMTMTEADGIKLNRELSEISLQLKSKDQNLKEDFQREQQSEIKKIRVKIQNAVNKIAKDGKYDMIVRTDAVAFRKDSADISKKVIKVLSNPAG